MPITFAAFALAAVSVIGLPPGGGTWSKWLLANATAEIHQPLLLAALMLSTLLNIAYLMPVVGRAFFRPLPTGAPSGIAKPPGPACCRSASRHWSALRCSSGPIPSLICCAPWARGL